MNIKTQYQADGFYLATEPIIPADLVERAGQGMDAIRRGEYDTGKPPADSMWNPGDDPNKLCKIEQPQFANRAIRELVSHRELGRVAAAITGASMVQVWWVQLLDKPPINPNAPQPTNIGLHQDRFYWRSWEEGSELFTAWVAISDVREDCGPMKFIRGSHCWGFRNQGDFFAQDVEAQRRAIDLPAGAVWEEVAAVLPPGGASFHDCLTFHGSGPNLSGYPRRSFALHMRTQNSRPVDNKREGLTQFIDNLAVCPVIYGERQL
ncbi:MAG: phytanoyl-CoA dioxygenase family protein [Abitibacteriaceae bacterium]|nr:phytanoyl-CoA dioxygenase family protein [Abditibacteriaceae bacterium]MBV9863710.1 phytanoyl-CoA dioxygenase family protein [Abditibacteriaceae bacterium]